MQQKFLFGTLLLYFCCLIPSLTYSQSVVLIDDEAFKEDAVSAIDSLYNRNAEASYEILEPWMDQYPDHPIWTMWSAMELWWDVLEDLNDHSYDDQLMEAMQRSDYQAGRLLSKEPDHPDGLMIRALANGYIARHLSNREEWIQAMRVGRKSYVAYERIMEVRPDLKDNEFVEGMKLYYSAYVPDKYPAVRAVSWFLPDGDRQKGLELIGNASVEGVFSRPEATYFMGNILLNYEENSDKALSYFELLVEQYPNNSYYRRLIVRTLFNQERMDAVRLETNDAIEHWSEGSLHGEEILKEELYYWSGRAHFRAGRVDEASDDFEKSIAYGNNLPNRERRIFYSLSNYYAGLAAERSNDKEAARSYYNVALKQEADGDYKKRARERLKNL
ncbi:MAG: tetratricopeptide repeat protein [Balneolaceae bacterium]